MDTSAPEEDNRRKRLLECFPSDSDHEDSMPARIWYESANDHVAKGFQGLNIDTLLIDQQALINRLSEDKLFLVLEYVKLTRPSRLISMVMQACAETAVIKDKQPSPSITEAEFDDGLLARPRVLIIISDHDIDPGIFMDGFTVAQDTGVKLATPSISVAFPGDEQLHLTNADIVFTTLNDLKKHVGKKAIFLDRVKRVITDEPAYLGKDSQRDMAMLFRHPEMNKAVRAAFVGGSLDDRVVQKITKFVNAELPTYKPHTTNSRNFARGQWHKYSLSL
ncbi:hypothetical protein E4T47_01974 [Aureobasidium subglaciale]|nr:hypothetical protein E4T47_01974 [Aureobasidium subglaciale]